MKSFAWIALFAGALLGLSGCGPEDQAQANGQPAQPGQAQTAAVETPPMPPAN